MEGTETAEPAGGALREQLVGSKVGGVVLRIIRGVGWSLIVVGVLLLGFVAHQLWVTDFFAQRAQNALEEELAVRVEEGVEVVPFDPATGEVADDAVGTLTPEEIAGGGVGDPSTTPQGIVVPGVDSFLLRDPAPDTGDAIGTIRIPDIGLTWTVVEGVRRPQLNKGAGHMPDTPLPGQPGNAVVSGHRTTHGRPFHNVDDLEVGDLIFWDSPMGTHTYQVRDAPLVVKPTALWVTNAREGAWLTLTTCHPKFSARERLIIFAEMVDGPNASVIYGQA